MLTTYTSITDLFPHEEFKQGQKETIEKFIGAFNSGKRHIIFEGPCGSGKSAIALTVARHFNRVYWLCPQKILQDQIVRDYGNNNEIIDLKGRNSYPCDYWNTVNTELNPTQQQKIMKFANKQPSARWVMDTNLNCNEGVCRLRDKTNKCKECKPSSINSFCPYYRRLRETQASSIALMNFSSFIYQTAFTDSFKPRDLLIIDECHNLEGELLDFISITLDDRDFDFKFPAYDTANEYLKYFKDKKLGDIIKSKVQYANLVGDLRAEDQWKSVLTKYNIFCTDLNNDGFWTCEHKEKGPISVIQFKPIYVDRFAEQYIFNWAPHVLMMSATVLNPKILSESLGINLDQTFSHQMKNRFPKENRPIKFTPSGSLSYRNKHKTYPKLVSDIDALCEKHEGERGIIHTHNFEISKLLLEECSNAGRFLYQDDWDSKEEMLNHHHNNKDTVIVAPAMHEGLDLKDDLARWQVIVKVPYPNFVDNQQLKIRMDLDRTYYPWLTALKVVQSAGRAVRSETDHAVTYIMDRDFKNFYDRNKKLLPKWFRESLIW